LRGAFATKQSIWLARRYGLLRRGLSSGARSRDPLARNDGAPNFGEHFNQGETYMDIEATAHTLDGKQWEKDLPGLGDLEVLVAPWENPAFERALGKAIRALPPGLRAEGNIDPAAYYRVVGVAMAKTILFDWKNFKAGGVEKPFEPAYVLTVLTDPKYKTLRDGVVAAARRMQLGIKAEQDELVGNLSASSLGSGSGEAMSEG
jgi:hypothetical protein